MMKEGENEKALMFVEQQRSLFPEENAVEEMAFEVISGCIKERTEATREAAADFIDTHPNFRLNRHISRLCSE